MVNDEFRSPICEAMTAQSRKFTSNGHISLTKWHRRHVCLHGDCRWGRNNPSNSWEKLLIVAFQEILLLFGDQAPVIFRRLYIWLTDKIPTLFMSYILAPNLSSQNRCYEQFLFKEKHAIFCVIVKLGFKAQTEDIN